jgi:death-on-curing protein
MSEEDTPRFLSLAQVMALHRRSLAEHGGLEGVRDPGAVESALASAQNTWLYADGDWFDIAAAYAFHIAEAQAFLDGNKRTAVASAIAFLTANGCADRGDDRVLYDAMIALSARRMDKAGLAAVLREQFPRAAGG